MSEHTALMQSLKAELLRRRDELAQRLEAIKGDMSTPLDHDFAEQAVELENGEVLAALGNEAQAEIQRINRALIAMEEGSYGSCVTCGAAIPEARLKASPFSARCIACATRSEARD